MTAPSGLLVIDKPDGMTSHDVVGAVRRALDTRRVGHAGTLDPMATGVLVVGVGWATRLLGFLAGRDKDYRATIRLGASTVTDDREGEVLATAPATAIAALTDAVILDALASFRGDIAQVPSAVSAVKVDGRRAHARVRAGEDVTLAPRSVHVSRFEAERIDRAQPGVIDVDVEVTCSSGTYVRALARDLGAALGVGGHLTALRRTRVGPWTLADAIALDAIGPTGLIAIDAVAARAFPVVAVDDARVEDLRHGRRTPWPAGMAGTIALTDADGHLIAIAEQRDDAARTLVVVPGA